MSLRKYEGYVMIDHRASPGLPADIEHARGLPPGAGQGLFEAPTYTCSHCQSIVIINPDRKRERASCSSCGGRRLCDACGALYAMNKECKNIFKVFDQLQEAAVKRSHIL